MVNEVALNDDLDCDEVELNPGEGEEELGLESLSLLLCSKSVKDIEARIRNEFEDLKQRQAQVRYLHKLLKIINAHTDAKGKFDASQDKELQKLLDQAAEMGVMLPNSTYKFSSDEKTRLVDSVRMTCDDLNLQNEMQMQTVSRLTNERYEAYQMARSILRPLHEAKVNGFRGMGRG